MSDDSYPASVTNMERVIKRLLALRTSKGLSLESLADQSGVPEINIRRLNNGQRTRLTIDEAIALCAALDVDLRDVLTDRPLHVRID